ncbi:MAG: DUF4858 domain-containing protein [Bacteroides sp.]|nr:DUF4858 domain-containing protein [Bacteroides sp.]
MLDGETDILINPAVKQEIDLLFAVTTHIHNTPILPIEQFLPQLQNRLKEYQMPKFRLNGAHIYYGTPLRTEYFLSNKRFSISATSEKKRTKILLEQKTDFKFDITKSLDYHIYAGYSLHSSKSAILPGAVTPLYFGSGFSYHINQRVEIKTGIERQFNVIQKRWEWLWRTGVGVNF